MKYRVLFLFWNRPETDTNGRAKRLHYGLLSRLAKRDKINFFVYGPDTETLVESVPVAYSKKLRFRDIRDKIKPDVVLMYHVNNVMSWLPRDFKEVQVPKVMIECDWWYIKPRLRRWYKEHGVDFLIQRGMVDDQGTGLRSTWLPFSADENDFVKHQSRRLAKRKMLLGFIGRGSDKRIEGQAYHNRSKMIAALDRYSLLKTKGVVGHSRYPIELSKFVAYFSDCGRLNSPPGKVFEIMASGSLLYTDDFAGRERLFGKEEVCKFWTSEKDVVEKARVILNSNVSDLQRVVDRAVDIVNQKHLHKHRVVELEHILISYLENKKVERIWGI